MPDGPEEGRPVPGGKDRPRAKHGEGRDRRAPSTRKAVRLREANWYPTRNVGASEAIQISANRAECVFPWIDHIRDEKLPASSQRERDVADVDRDRHPFGREAPIEKRHCQQSAAKSSSLSPPADETVQPSRKLVLNPSDDLPKIDAMIHYALS